VVKEGGREERQWVLSPVLMLENGTRPFPRKGHTACCVRSPGLGGLFPYNALPLPAFLPVPTQFSYCLPSFPLVTSPFLTVSAPSSLRALTTGIWRWWPFQACCTSEGYGLVWIDRFDWRKQRKYGSGQRAFCRGRCVPCRDEQRLGTEEQGRQLCVVIKVCGTCSAIVCIESSDEALTHAVYSVGAYRWMESPGGFHAASSRCGTTGRHLSSST
jgi:hypothetical protein